MTRNRFEITLLQLLKGKATFPLSLPGLGIGLASAMFIGIPLFFEWQSAGGLNMYGSIPGAVSGLAKEFLFSSLYDAIKSLVAAMVFRGCAVATGAWGGFAARPGNCQEAGMEN